MALKEGVLVSCRNKSRAQPQRRRFFKRRNRVEPTSAPPPTLASPPTAEEGFQTSSGVTIALSTTWQKKERAKLILWWTSFLNSIAVQVNGAESDTLQFSKLKIVEFILEIMEDITAHPDPGSFFRKTLDTVTELSKIKPPLPEELRSAVLHVAVSGANYLEPGTHNETFQSLQRMIRGFLEEAPSVHNLTSILTELQRYSTAKDPQLQALAQEACSCRLQHAASLPAFHLKTLKDAFPVASKSSIQDDLVLEEFDEEEEFG
ncbi:uncharacterized protein LOC128343701 [Hemicordylus capensis]|uniref:uncharacterized protein LOC128343701 n=1 Tax=Hemicordylus capensis TaxID=884348 RepID=UPI00230234F8|nr:uncharacterized protein LOC128343701 [Hemicordylus capensis]